MKTIDILCWNVNGIRAIMKKGFLEWLGQSSPDILCLQETRVQPDQISSDIQQLSGYHVCWSYPERRGYSGVATLAKEKPAVIKTGFGIERFDIEGRVIVTEYSGFSLFNVYFPNGKMSEERLKYKMDFYNAFLGYVDLIREKGGKIIICGDFNTAHKAMDLARPKENEKVSGFLPVERAWIDTFVDHGYVDTFRHFNQQPNQYTWWDLKTRARERNVGWRIDYFFVNKEFIPHVKSAFILQEVSGSDHCPIGIEIT